MAARWIIVAHIIGSKDLMENYNHKYWGWHNEMQFDAPAQRNSMQHRMNNAIHLEKCFELRGRLCAFGLRFFFLYLEKINDFVECLLYI